MTVRHVAMSTTVPDATSREVFARLSDFERYADYTDAVREVVVTPLEDGTVHSRWSVNFRSGVLCWSERDIIDAGTGTISFNQLEGDFTVFQGSWIVDQIGPDVRILFAADFDLGMPSLAPMIDPIAERTLIENLQAILHGLLGSAIRFDFDQAGSEEPTQPLAV